MTFLFWTFVFFLSLYLGFRFFGRQISRFLLRKLTNKLVNDMNQASQAYERNYDQGDMQTNVYVDNEIKVSAPRGKSKPTITADEIAEDVEFEEVH
jgi:hypothetical protein